MNSSKINCVLLAERHSGLMEGIRRTLETSFDIVLMAGDARSLVEGAQRVRPSLVIMELSLSLETLRTLRARCPEAKVIVLSMHTEPAIIRGALDAGALGYVLKQTIGTDLLPCVETVLAGQICVSPGTHFFEPTNNK